MTEAEPVFDPVVFAVRLDGTATDGAGVATLAGDSIAVEVRDPDVRVAHLELEVTNHASGVVAISDSETGAPLARAFVGAGVGQLRMQLGDSSRSFTVTARDGGEVTLRRLAPDPGHLLEVRGDTRRTVLVADSFWSGLAQSTRLGFDIAEVAQRLQPSAHAGASYRVAPGAVLFGAGWNKPEQHQGDTFRWLGLQGQIAVVGDVDYDGPTRGLLVKFEHGPCLDDNGGQLHLSHGSERVASSVVRGNATAFLPLPEATVAGVQVFDLALENPNPRPFPRDPRLLNLRILDMRLCTRNEYFVSQADVTHGADIIDPTIAGHLESSGELPADSVVLGSGWHKPEHRDDETFRWIGESVQIYVTGPGEDTADTAARVVVLDVIAGPTLHQESAELRLVTRDGTVVSRSAVPHDGEMFVELPADVAETTELHLTVHNPNPQVFDKDPRTLNVRVNRIGVSTRDELILREARRSSLEDDITDPEIHDRLRTNEQVPPDAVMLGAAWNAPESRDGETFRWIAEKAPIFVSEAAAGSTATRGVVLDVVAGPTLNQSDASLSLVAADGTATEPTPIPHSGRLFLPLPADQAGIVSMSLEIHNPNPVPFDKDPRTLNLRVSDIRIATKNAFIASQIELTGDRADIIDGDALAHLEAHGGLPANAVVLGSGWNAPESRDDETFRWIADKAPIYVTPLDPDRDSTTGVVLDVVAGPTFNHDSGELQLLDESGAEVGRWRVPYSGELFLPLPSDIDETTEFQLVIVNPDPLKFAGDPRTLNLRVNRIGLTTRNAFINTQVMATSRADDITDPATHIHLQETGELPSGAVVLGADWHNPESRDGETFRWIADSVPVYVTPPDAPPPGVTHGLVLDVVAGPTLNQSEAQLHMTAADRTTLFTTDIPHEGRLFLPLPSAVTESTEILLTIDNPNPLTFDADPRTLNLRVLSISMTTKSDFIASQVMESSLETDITNPEIHAHLLEHKTLPPNVAVLGSGWNSPEHRGEETFRWVADNAPIFITPTDEAAADAAVTRGLMLDIVAGPTLGQTDTGLRLVSADSEDDLANSPIPHHGQLFLPLPSDLTEVTELALVVDNPKPAVFAGDPRTLNLRVNKLQVVTKSEFIASQVMVTSQETDITDPEVHSHLVETGELKPNAVVLGSGWNNPEHRDDETFRWLALTAPIFVTPRSTGVESDEQTLGVALDVVAGPTLNQPDAQLLLIDSAGETLAASAIPTSGGVFLELPAGITEIAELTLTVDNPNPVVFERDPRTLNLRINQITVASRTQFVIDQLTVSPEDEDIVAAVAPESLLSPEALVADAVLLGDGWMRPEQRDGEVFRWVGDAAPLFVTPARSTDEATTGGTRGLVLHVSAGPTLNRETAVLHLRNHDGDSVATSAIPTDDSLFLPLPDTAEIASLTLSIDNPDPLVFAKDPRTLNMRVTEMKVARRDEFIAAQVQRMRSTDDITDAAVYAELDSTGAIPPNAVVLAAGWNAPESRDGETFRWISEGAPIYVTPAANTTAAESEAVPAVTSGVVLDLHAGPTLNLSAAELRLVDAAGETLASSAIPHHGRVFLSIPADLAETTSFDLVVHNPNPRVFDFDPRLLNVKVDHIRVATKDEFIASQVTETANEDDITDPAIHEHLDATGALPPDAVVLGSGWNNPESLDDEWFRWVADRAPIYVSPASDWDRTRGLVLDVVAGPTLNQREGRLLLVDATDQTEIARSEIPHSGRLFVPLPSGMHETAELELVIDNPNAQTFSDDARTLNLRIQSIAVITRDDFIASQVSQTPHESDIVDDGIREHLAETGSLPANALVLGSGWNDPETREGESFRWVADRAPIFVTAPEAGDDEQRGIVIDIDAGPTLNQRFASLHLMDADNNEILWSEIPHSGRLFLALPAGLTETTELELLIRNPSPETFEKDPRTLNLRVSRIWVASRSEWVLSQVTDNGAEDVTDESISAYVVANNELPANCVVLGAGWNKAETFKGDTFRWLENDAEIIVSPCDPGTADLIILNVTAGPSLTVGPATVQLLDFEGEFIDEAPVPHKGDIALRLPEGTSETADYILQVINPEPLLYPDDPRELNIRVEDIRMRSTADHDLKTAALLNLALADITDEATRLHLRQTHTLPVDSVVLIGPWAAPELGQGDPFRWITGAHDLLVSHTSGTEDIGLIVDVTPGPCLGTETAAIELHDGDSNVLASKPINEGGAIFLPLPDDVREQSRYALVVSNPDPVTYDLDDRQLDARLNRLTVSTLEAFRIRRVLESNDWDLPEDTTDLDALRASLPADGAGFADGWYAAETFEGATFSWSPGKGSLLVNSANAGLLRVTIASGNALPSEDAVVIVRDGKGQQVSVLEISRTITEHVIQLASAPDAIRWLEFRVQTAIERPRKSADHRTLAFRIIDMFWEPA